MAVWLQAGFASPPRGDGNGHSSQQYLSGTGPASASKSGRDLHTGLYGADTAGVHAHAGSVGASSGGALSTGQAMWAAAVGREPSLMGPGAATSGGGSLRAPAVDASWDGPTAQSYVRR
jgi:hypothetical protein